MTPFLSCLLQLRAPCSAFPKVSLFLGSFISPGPKQRMSGLQETVQSRYPAPLSPLSQSPYFFMYVHALLFTNEVLLDTNNACSPMDISTDQWHMKKGLHSTLKKILHLLTLTLSPTCTETNKITESTKQENPMLWSTLFYAHHIVSFPSCCSVEFGPVFKKMSRN